MDNYVWIMIICVVLLMALIGYIAEKQGEIPCRRGKTHPQRGQCGTDAGHR